MKRTLIVQSHTSPLPYPWLQACLDSVRHWSYSEGHEYRFIGDELFAYLADDLQEKLQSQRVIASDLARLLWMAELLQQGYEQVVWLDADFLIFHPQAFVLPDADHAIGREVWVQYDKQQRLKVYKKVHNAFLLFRQHNSLLPFYIDSAQRLLTEHQATMPPQFIGPKLLTALHNISRFTVMESAGMLSPLVIADLLGGEGEALRLFRQHSSMPIAAANLCSSSCERGELSNPQMLALIGQLSSNGTALFAEA